MVIDWIVVASDTKNIVERLFGVRPSVPKPAAGSTVVPLRTSPAIEKFLPSVIGNVSLNVPADSFKITGAALVITPPLTYSCAIVEGPTRVTNVLESVIDSTLK